MKIVLFGSRHIHDIAWQLNKNFDLLLLVTTDQGTIQFAASEKIPFTQALSIDSKLISEIKKLKPDIGVVADFGIIIPKVLIDLFPKGILNVHPSLLPLYRGPTPVQTAILNGDRVTGISIIKIDEQMDHGPIVYQEEYEISPNDNADKLLMELFARAGKILPNLLREYVLGNVILSQQNDKKASYTKILTKEDGFVDVNNPPEKRELRRMINALNPWPGVWTRYPLNPKQSLKPLIKLLPGQKIQVEGKRPMSYKDFMNGYPEGKFFLEKLSLI